MDLEWYARMAVIKPSVYILQQPYCFYRFHDDAKTATCKNSLQEEAIDIAIKYSYYLSKNERKKLQKIIAYTKILKECQKNQNHKSIIDLLKILLMFPHESLRNKFVLGLLKTKVLHFYY